MGVFTNALRRQDNITVYVFTNAQRCQDVNTIGGFTNDLIYQVFATMYGFNIVLTHAKEYFITTIIIWLKVRNGYTNLDSIECFVTSRKSVF